MNYESKRWLKVILLLLAVAIAGISLFVTNRLVARLKAEEVKKMEIWADATRLSVDFLGLETSDTNMQAVLDEISNHTGSIISDNTTIPVILTDEQERILSYRNLDTGRLKQENYLQEQLTLMKEQHEPIKIEYPGGFNYIYFKNSTLLTQLSNFPIYQIAIVAVFLLAAYLAFSSSRRSEQNKVWVGMAKETAHQLGTPISSLLAWLEYVKLTEGHLDEESIHELEQDVRRLETIADRFSKIGSLPQFTHENLEELMRKAMGYLSTRTSSRVNFIIEQPEEPILVNVCVPLFEWVIENLTKNAVDAMDGVGSITVKIKQRQQKVFMDIIDTGKGIPSGKFKTVFKPGFTTKKRGWGLGLSLAKRIIEEYHQGEIFVKQSIPGKGTTFRIILKHQGQG